MKIRKLTLAEKRFCREIARLDREDPKKIERLFVESGVIDLGVLPSYSLTQKEQLRIKLSSLLKPEEPHV